jgi:hypothetical protein
VDDDEVRRALERNAGREFDFTLRVAVLLGLELKRVKVARTLGASGAEVRAAVDRLKRIAGAIYRYSDSP